MEDSIVNGLLLPSAFFAAEGILNTGEKIESLLIQCHRSSHTPHVVGSLSDSSSESSPGLNFFLLDGFF